MNNDLRSSMLKGRTSMGWCCKKQSFHGRTPNLHARIFSPDESTGRELNSTGVRTEYRTQKNGRESVRRNKKKKSSCVSVIYR